MIDDFPAEDEQRQHSQKREPRCQNRSTQRLVDAVVHNRLEIVPATNLLRQGNIR